MTTDCTVYIARHELPALGMQPGDCLVYEAGTPRPWSVVRDVSPDLRAIGEAAEAGTLDHVSGPPPLRLVR